MAFHWQIETTKSISWKTISSTLQKNSLGSEIFDNFVNDRFEDEHKWLIIKSLVKGKVDRMISSIIFPYIFNVTCSWEVIFELMEGTSHHPVGEIEGLLNSISMVDVDVDV